MQKSKKPRENQKKQKKTIFQKFGDGVYRQEFWNIGFIGFIVFFWFSRGFFAFCIFYFYKSSGILVLLVLLFFFGFLEVFLIFAFFYFYKSSGILVLLVLLVFLVFSRFF